MLKTLCLFCSLFLSANCFADDPRIGGAWVELRTSPLFESPTEKMADTWGERIPPNDEFVVEKMFGRWIYGKPVPLKNMRKRDYPPAGWVYSRMLLLPGDESTASKTQAEEIYLTTHYSLLAWKKLGFKPMDNAFLSMDFLESLVLSRKTMLAFRHFDEQTGNSASFPGVHLETEAQAEEKIQDEYGLVGANLDFLKQEFSAQQSLHQKVEKKRLQKILLPPRVAALSSKVKTDILGRYMLNKYFTMPQLSHDEVDGFIYMKAITERALEGCSPKIQAYWQKRHWNIFRVYQLKSQADKNPWYQLELPGGYFSVSARAIDTANNEAELAFLLIRPLVRELRIHPPAPKFGKKWPEELASLSETEWQEVLKNQSTLNSKNVDVSDEIQVDTDAVECLSRAGYASGAPLSYLKHLSMSREQPWAKWLSENMIGIDYRVERLGALIPEAIASHSFPEGHVVNQKRFSQATKGWNVLP
jgi:hypothetical protein